jgi:hypothetical protein
VPIEEEEEEEEEEVGLTELDKTKKYWFIVCCFKSDKSYIVKILCANKFSVIMC